MTPTLVVLRGNSASGKSSVAREVRRRYGRGCALVEQDHLRRILLREHDGPDGVAPRLIEATCRVALDGGYHVLLEGILHAAWYGAMLRSLIREHDRVFYLDVSLEETVRRHETRPLSREVTAEEMRSWYTPRDLLGLPGETVIPETSTFAESVATVLRSLADAPALAPCPTRCERCRR